ncbi:hypothetical protein AB0I28_13305 [Phytomonospora sp. NPDC050363]|uniref:hypothetical protein n=1 Tax=Phytomonospora sp. NPDC050363 TaxID=3155642 RepID=UPI0033EA633E
MTLGTLSAAHHVAAARLLDDGDPAFEDADFDTAVPVVLDTLPDVNDVERELREEARLTIL